MRRDIRWTVLVMQLSLCAAIFPPGPWAGDPMFSQFGGMFGTGFTATTPPSYWFPNAEHNLLFDQNIGTHPLAISVVPNQPLAKEITPVDHAKVSMGKPMSKSKDKATHLETGQPTVDTAKAEPVALKQTKRKPQVTNSGGQEKRVATVPPAAFKPLFTNWPSDYTVSGGSGNVEATAIPQTANKPLFTNWPNDYMGSGGSGNVEATAIPQTANKPLFTNWLNDYTGSGGSGNVEATAIPQTANTPLFTNWLNDYTGSGGSGNVEATAIPQTANTPLFTNWLNDYTASGGSGKFEATAIPQTANKQLFTNWLNDYTGSGGSGKFEATAIPQTANTPLFTNWPSDYTNRVVPVKPELPANPPTPVKPLFTNWPREYPTSDTKQCVHGGQTYAPLTEITRGRSGDWCYGSYCNHEGAVEHWDDYNCKQPALEQLPTQTVSKVEAGCWYNGAWFAHGSDIDNGRSYHTDMCYGTYCDAGSNVVHWEDYCSPELTSMAAFMPPPQVECPTC